MHSFRHKTQLFRHNLDRAYNQKFFQGFHDFSMLNALPPLQNLSAKLSGNVAGSTARFRGSSHLSQHQMISKASL